MEVGRYEICERLIFDLFSISYLNVILLFESLSLKAGWPSFDKDVSQLMFDAVEELTQIRAWYRSVYETHEVRSRPSLIIY